MGPLHSKVGVEAFEKTLKEINDIGGEVLCGGSQAKMSSEFAGGNWVAPTIVRVPKGSAVMQRETFAPGELVQSIVSSSVLTCRPHPQFFTFKSLTRSRRPSS